MLTNPTREGAPSIGPVPFLLPVGFCLYLSTRFQLTYNQRKQKKTNRNPNPYRGGAIKLNPGSCSHDQVRSVTEARRLCHHPLVARSLLRQRMTLGA